MTLSKNLSDARGPLRKWRLTSVNWRLDGAVALAEGGSDSTRPTRLKIIRSGPVTRAVLSVTAFKLSQRPGNNRVSGESARLTADWGRLILSGLSVWSAVAVASQVVVPAALSSRLRAHVKAERFEIVTSITGLPLGVRDGLQTLFGSQTLDIAGPGAEFQETDVVGPSKLPIRRLVAAGCAADHHCLVSLRARRR